MEKLREVRTKFTNHGWKKALGLALFLVACDPFVPTIGGCGNLPACSSMNYGLEIRTSSYDGIMPELVTGAYPIDSLGFRLFVEFHGSGAVACPRSGRPGFAYATSCAPCSGKYLTVDSLYFTTDILLMGGDTLKAGYNFAEGSDVVGISGGGSSMLVRAGFPTRFRDSIFEVRFTGFADTVQKTGSITLQIRNPALLIPQ
jgi:hypothetical protein